MKKGFTLIELLGVIVILGILVLVAFPPLLNQIKKSKDEINDATKLLIIDAAKDYVEDNKNDYIKDEGLIYCINISALTDNNYLNEKIKNESFDDIDTTQKIKLTYHNDKFEYDITNNCINNSLARNGIEVALATENSGLYESTTEKGRFIYRGGNPINNWVELNEGTEETPDYVKYRIVSFEPDGTIKVVRDERIRILKEDETVGGIAWDTTNARKSDGTNNTYCTSSSGCNVWGNQNNTLYNGESLGDNFHYIYYKKATDIALTHSTMKGKVSIDSTLNQYLNSGSWTPLSTLNEYIENHEFNVGGVYNLSTQNKSMSQEKEEESQLKWNGKIGLLNITEYAEASLNPTCVNAMSNTATNGRPCKELNWTYKNNYSQWTLSPSSYQRSTVWYVNSSGEFGGSVSATNPFGVRPTFYLKSGTKLTGQGIENNPYKIQ